MSFHFLVADNEGSQLKAISVENRDNWLPLKEMDIGTGTTRALAHISSGDRQKEILMGIRKSLKMIVTYLKDCYPLDHVLRDLQCLHPLS